MQTKNLNYIVMNKKSYLVINIILFAFFINNSVSARRADTEKCLRDFYVQTFCSVDNYCAPVQIDSKQIQDAIVDREEKSDSTKSVFYNAFSHNDYWRSRPLTEALSYRFNCVEADLWLIDGELYVAHGRSEIKKENTFESMYLKPLAELIKKNGGKVYTESSKPFFLMVDCKTNGEAMYPVLKKIMEPYKDLFCSIDNGEYKEGAILFFLSGDRPLETLPEETSRFVFLDGRVKDLEKGISAHLMPVISNSYTEYFKWKGEGEIPENELRKMREIISQTHKEGKLLRWWGAPETKDFTLYLIKEGVDLIGSDNLEQLYNILVEYR